MLLLFEAFDGYLKLLLMLIKHFCFLFFLFNNFFCKFIFLALVVISFFDGLEYANFSEELCKIFPYVTKTVQIGIIQFLNIQLQKGHLDVIESVVV